MSVRAWAADAWRALAFRALTGLRDGRVTVVDATTRRVFVGEGRSDLSATIVVQDPAAYRRFVLAGSLGGAEAFLRGEWRTDDLPALLRVLAANASSLEGVEALARVATLPAVIAHRFRWNSRGGSRRNIRAHYDLGDELFGLFLDRTMTYSCGVFAHEDATLEEASLAKLDLVCRKLGLDASHHVLEIGGGWGSFAIHAATHYGCRVTTTTVSRAQFDTAVARVAAAGLAHRVTVLQRDYRDLSGTFDRVVSIEMIEAVGPGYLKRYFDMCSSRLAPGGLMLLQGIVLPEYRYRRYLRSADFIQRYVFPGGALTSLGAITGALADTDLSVLHVEDFSPHYARTLQLWREAFLAKAADARRIGFDARFLRLWEFYLAYCEAGFAERCTGVVQMLLARPARGHAPAWSPLTTQMARRTASA